MNPSALLKKEFTVDPTPIPRPDSAIQYERIQNKKRIKKLKAEQYKIRRPNE